MQIKLMSLARLVSAAVTCSTLIFLAACGGGDKGGLLAQPQPLPATLAEMCSPQALQPLMAAGVTVKDIPNLLTYLPDKLKATKGGVLLVPENALGDGAPSYCFVTGSMVTNPATGKTANFGAYLPAPGKWNGRFLQIGCGGNCGEVFESGPPAAAHIRAGFAIWANDGGHIDAAITKTGITVEADSSWAVKSPGVIDQDALDDYMFRADHVTAVLGKQSTSTIYGAAKVNQSYFMGCSHGGHEAMNEAVRYPEDHDGIVAWAPYQPVANQLQFMADNLVQLRSMTAALSPDQIILVSNLAIAACDAADGVTDGLVQNPNACTFDPSRDIPVCAAGHAPDATCLSQEQVQAVASFVNAVRDSSDNVVSAGWSATALAPWLMNLPSSPLTLTGNDVFGPEPWLQSFDGWSFSNYTVQNFVYAGAADYNGTSTLRYSFGVASATDPSSFHATVPTSVVQKFKQALAGGDWTSTSGLDAFIARGGKLIMAHGLADQALNSNSTIAYYRNLADAKSGYAELGKNVRLFLQPGVEHCGGGPGPDAFLKLANVPGFYFSPDVPFDPQHDALASVMEWVEKGTAPNSIIATKYATDGTTVVRTMPLCPFPAAAQYKGSGSVNDAANWMCVDGNAAMLNIGLDGVRAGM